jgi:hypothetical protein
VTSPSRQPAHPVSPSPIVASTFATNGERALCVLFEEPVRVLDPTGRLLRHPSAVADPPALATALAHA